MLPKLINLKSTCKSTGRATRLFNLFACPSLKHLDTGDGWFSGNTRWVTLPPKHRELRCGHLPLPGAPVLSASLPLIHLERIHLHKFTSITVYVIPQCQLLEAASSLKVMPFKESKPRNMVWNDHLLPRAHLISSDCMSKDRMNDTMHLVSHKSIPSFMMFERAL